MAKNGPAADTYAKDRQVADTAYQNLAKHKQAAAQKPLLDGIKTKLDKAAELAKDPAKVTAANAELKLAKQEIDAATKVLGEADKVGVVAGNAADATTGKKSLDALKISLAAAKKHKHAADFANEFKALDAKVASAETKLKDATTVPDAIKEIKTHWRRPVEGHDPAHAAGGVRGGAGGAGNSPEECEGLARSQDRSRPTSLPWRRPSRTPTRKTRRTLSTSGPQAMEKAREAADLAEKTADREQDLQHPAEESRDRRERVFAEYGREKAGDRRDQARQPRRPRRSNTTRPRSFL